MPRMTLRTKIRQKPEKREALLKRAEDLLAQIEVI
tara:strand:+ start:492 stop:596 length:105 start_codon:yes stop_codon:yes gene_type:complete